MAPAIAKAFPRFSSVEYTRNYAQVENDPSFTELITKIGVPFSVRTELTLWNSLCFRERIFLFFSTCVPSVFMLMGTGLEYPLHHPSYDIPESMLFSAAWEAYMALRSSFRINRQEPPFILWRGCLTPRLDRAITETLENLQAEPFICWQNTWWSRGAFLELVENARADSRQVMV